MKERNYEKDQNALKEAYRQLAEAENALLHVFAVFDLKTGTFKDIFEEMHKTKYTLSKMKENNLQIMDCCNVIEQHGIELEEENLFSNHLTVALMMTKENVYADFEFNDDKFDYPYFSNWDFKEIIEPTLKGAITAFYKRKGLEFDADNIQNSDKKAISNFLAAIECGDRGINKLCETLITAMLKEN